MSCHSLLSCRGSAEKSADSLMDFPLYVTCGLSLAAFGILSLSLILDILIIICLGVGLFGLLLFGALCASWTWMSVSFLRRGKFSSIISTNEFSAPLSLSSPSGSPIIRMLACLILSQSSLTLFSFCLILFSLFCSAWVISSNLSSSSLIRFSASSTLLLSPSSEFLFQVLYSSFLIGSFLYLPVLC
uniref:Uncharacterized protein n=1 Tax=Equus caballus TaxID=9796 RepID=A0A9L0TV09_HORSE